MAYTTTWDGNKILPAVGGVPKITALANGTMLATWDNGTEIKGMLLNADGTARSDILTFGASTGGVAYPNDPRYDVAALSNGGFVLTWRDPAYGTVFAKIYDIALNPSGEIPIATAASSSTIPTIEALVGGGFVVSVDGMYRTYDNGGNLNPASVKTVVAYAPGGVENPMAALSNGNYVTVGFSQEPDGGHYLKVYIRTPLGDNPTGKPDIILGGGGSIDPAVTRLANGNFVVTWSEWGGVFARIFTANGDPVGGAIEVDAGTQNSEISVAPTADGGFFIGWIEKTGSSSTGYKNIFWRASYSEDGQVTAGKSSAAVPHSDSYGLSGAVPAVAGLGDGRVAVIWPDPTPPGGGTSTSIPYGDIKFQLYDTRIQTLGLGVKWDQQTTGGFKDIQYAGTVYGDELKGRDGNDTLYGYEGNDTLYGGVGYDSLNGGNGFDRVSYAEAGAGIKLNLDNSSDRAGEAAGDTLINIEAIEGSIWGDTIIGSSVNATGSTDASISLGADSFNGGGGNDRLEGMGGNDTLDGSYGHDVLIGAEGVDHLLGGFGDDTLDGGSSGDVFQGGDGIDIVSYASQLSAAADRVGVVAFLDPFVNPTPGVTHEDDAKGDTYESIEGLIGTKYNDILGGRNSYDDTMDGGDGDDTLYGGTGNDTYYVNSAGDQVREQLGQGTDTVIVMGTQFGGAYRLGRSGDYVENLKADNSALEITLTGSDTENYITGNAYANTLEGGGGNDTLEGGGVTLFTLDPARSFDILKGGLGDDTYYIRSDGSKIQVFENADEGKDTVDVTRDFTLGDDQHVEIIKVNSGSFSSLRLTGNNLVNSIYGGAGADTLDGGGASGGKDYLEGGYGKDTYIIRDLTNVTIKEVDNNNVIQIEGSLITSYTLDHSTQFTNLKAGSTAGEVTLIGNVYANLIVGNELANTIDGASWWDNGSEDTLRGMGGDDTYIVRQYDWKIDETSVGSSGNDTIKLVTGQSGSNTGWGYDFDIFNLGEGHGVENIDASALGDAYLELFGNSGDNLIIGSTGNNYLEGGLGKDTLAGGDGGDSYGIFYNDGGNSTYIIEEIGEGYDMLGVFADYTLNGGAEIERIDLGYRIVSGKNVGLNVAGNEFDNHIVGVYLGLAETLAGGGGNDTLEGGGGDDVYYVVDEREQVIEADTDAGGYDKLYLKTAAYTLKASSAVEELITDGTMLNTAMSIKGSDTSNVILGGTKNDIIDGGGGADLLNGGEDGDDTYYVDHVGDRIEDIRGNDTIRLTGSGLGTAFTLFDNIENLDARAVANGMTLTGNIESNEILGSNFADKLDGGEDGNDTLDGGEDGDTYFVHTSETVIGDTGTYGTDVIMTTVDYTLADAAGIEEIHANYSGSGVGLSLKGNALNNTIVGGDGDDTLDGADVPNFDEIGSDELRGGEGSDTYVVYSQSTIVVETGTAGTDKVVLGTGGYYEWGALDNALYILDNNVEDLDASTVTAGGMTLKGNGLANSIIGTASADIIEAGEGADILDSSVGEGDLLKGGNGSDTYRIRNAADVIEEIADASGGDDTAEIYVAEYKLADGIGVETLKAMVGSGVYMIGNDHTKTLEGNTGNDTLFGGAKEVAHVLRGGAGDDVYYIVNLNDSVEGEIIGDGGDVADKAILYRSLYEAANPGKTAAEIDSIIEGAKAALRLKGIELFEVRNGLPVDPTAPLAPTIVGEVLKVDEGTVPSVPVATVQSSDNEGDPIIYELADDFDDLFVIDAATGQIRLTRAVDFESTTTRGLQTDGGGKKYFELEVVATENMSGGKSSGKTKVLVYINDVSLAPTKPMVVGAVLEVNENILPSAPVATVSSYDDEMDPITYALADDFGDLFAIDAATGRITLTRPIDFEADIPGFESETDPVSGITRKYFDLVVTASDGPNISDPTTVRVYVNDLDEDGGNSAPVNVSLSRLKIHELASTGSVVGYLSAEDAPGDVIRYELVDNADGRFDLVGDDISGYRIVVKNGVKLDYEQMPVEGYYTIKVKASDGRLASDVVEFKITVTDRTVESTLGSAEADLIKGGAGGDRLLGGEGNDTLYGGAGNDLLGGGAGHDVFVFDTALNATTNVDALQDFTATGDSSDQIGLDLDVFSALSGIAGEALSADQFYIVGSVPAGASTRIIYNKATGSLFYDADGAGGDDMVEFAKVHPFLELTAGHFLLM